MDWTERIECTPDVIGGKPRIKGTRLAAELILEILAAGVTEQELFEHYYPNLTHEDVLACLGYASYLAHKHRYDPLPVNASAGGR